MKINFSNLSAREHLRLNGTIPVEMLESLLESLLDKEKAIQDISGIEAHLSESKGCFPAEDFLDPIRRELQELHKNLRGVNREKLGGILKSLDDLAQWTFDECEYGRDELRKALSIIQNAGAAKQCNSFQNDC